MRKAWLGHLAWAAVLGAAAWAAGAEPAAAPPKNVILIGWDGCQREHLRQCLARGELPALAQLAAEGKLLDIDIRGTTDTKAGWSQILTGYDPAITGVYSNSRFQPVPEGYSLFERLKTRFGADTFAAVAVIGKKAHCGEIRPPSKEEITEQQAVRLKQRATKGKKAKAAATAPKTDPAPAGGQAARGLEGPGKGVVGQGRRDVGVRVVKEGNRWYRVFPGSPYVIMKDACDVWEYGLLEDAKVGRRALELLDRYKDKPFFFFVHFAEVDHKGHKFGENSKEYNDAILSGDTWTGRIVQKLKDLGLYQKTLVYVTADHGFDEGKKTHKKAPFVFLGTNDPKVSRNGDRADVAPTIYEQFGVDFTTFTPPLSGQSLLHAALAPIEPPKTRAKTK